MTKTPLGKVAPTPRGEWSAEAAYTNLDIVRHDGKAFIVLRTVTGVTPCDDGENYRLLCADGDINSPRLPSYKVKKTVGDELVRFLSFADFADQNEKHYGLAGSATQVERIFPPEKNTEKRSITGSAAEQAEGIFDLLVDRKLI